MLGKFIAPVLALCLCLSGQCFALVRGNHNSLTLPSCNITKDIVANFSANNTGLVDTTPAFAGIGSFQDFAVNTYLPSHPNDTICLTVPAGTYLFATSGAFIFDGIPSLVVNGAGATFENVLLLNTTSPTVAGNNVLTFSGGVPSVVANGQTVDDLSNRSVTTGLTVASKTATTITLSGNVTAPGVSSGDQFQIGTTGGFFLGTQGLANDAAFTASLQAVTVGTTTLTASTHAQASRFTANTWALLGGIDLEGFGNPQNNYVWEYVFVTAVNATTGGITLQSPTKFNYETTWPQYNPGCATGGGCGSPTANQGGPATLFVLPSSWNAAHYYNGLTLFSNAGQGTGLNQNGRSLTYNNCTFVNWGPNLSVNASVTYNNCNMANVNRIETDKFWDIATFNGGTVEGFFIQSGSTTGTLALNGTHILSGSISGAPSILTLNNVTMDGALQYGATTYGNTNTVNCTNSSIPSGITLGGVFDPNITLSPMASGIITAPFTATSYVTPNAEMYWTGGGSTFTIPYLIIDLTGNGSNTFIQTSNSGGYPTGTNGTRSSPAKIINFSGCTGSPDIVDVSQAGARNARPFTYSNRIYTCTNNVATVQAANPSVPVINLNSPPASQPVIARSITSFTINVSRADTGTSPTVNFHPMTPFDNYSTYDPTGTKTLWGAKINLKNAGNRVYTGSTSSWSGIQTGDTLPTISNPSYMSGEMTPFIDTDITGELGSTCPIVTVTIQTN